MLKRARQAECLPTLICKLLILSGGAGSFASIPHTFPKAQAFCGAGDLVAGVSAFKTKSPAGGKDRQRHNAGFPLEKSKWHWAVLPAFFRIHGLFQHPPKLRNRHLCWTRVWGHYSRPFALSLSI
jgi:hypothetical protein